MAFKLTFTDDRGCNFSGRHPCIRSCVQAHALRRICGQTAFIAFLSFDTGRYQLPSGRTRLQLAENKDIGSEGVPGRPDRRSHAQTPAAGVVRHRIVYDLVIGIGVLMPHQRRRWDQIEGRSAGGEREGVGGGPAALINLWPLGHSADAKHAVRGTFHSVS